MVNFKIGEFASLQGQIVEILDIVYLRNDYEYIGYKVKIKLLNDTLTHTVNSKDLKKIDNQDTPRILFKNNKK